ncbi:hypothetical protein ABVK25_002507 [Lepraria finkii]|uniref:Uncharacterized protein n=1 Tax=Lepraria finkii TaxID=1340010 RepID=A0ABR4BL18_9LECA
MVILYQSQTLAINSPSASPTLSIDEMWEVMLLKCRKPELFVAPMSGSAIIEETPTFMKRSVTLKEGMGPPGGEAIEELQIRAPWKIDFYNLNSGAFINNTVPKARTRQTSTLPSTSSGRTPICKRGVKRRKKC